MLCSLWSAVALIPGGPCAVLASSRTPQSWPVVQVAALSPIKFPTQKYNELTQGAQWIKIGPTQHWFQAVVKNRTGPDRTDRK